MYKFYIFILSVDFSNEGKGKEMTEKSFIYTYTIYACRVYVCMWVNVYVMLLC